MRFDFTVRKTESEWAAAISTFLKNFGEATFRIVGWSAAIAALALANGVVKSLYITIAIVVLKTTLYMYLWGYFILRFEVVIFSEERLVAWRRWVALVVHTAVASGIFLAVNFLTQQVVDGLVAAARK